MFFAPCLWALGLGHVGQMQVAVTALALLLIIAS